MRNILLVIIVVLVVGGGFLLFRPAQSTEQDTMDSSSPTGVMTADQTATGESQGTVKEFTVDGNDYAFSLKEMTVNQGDTVKITFKNTKGIHDFVLDEFNVATKQISAGQEETVEFVAEKSGTFEYYCSVGNHRQMGMKGTLTVK